MKPKEWLLKNGHISEIKRGRMSREHIELIQDAVRSGVVIEGYAVSTVQPKTAEEPKEVKKVPTGTAQPIFKVPDESRDERDFKASGFLNGKKVPVGMRTVCNGCGSSLTYCHCANSRVWVSHEHESVVVFSKKR